MKLNNIKADNLLFKHNGERINKTILKIVFGVVCVLCNIHFCYGADGKRIEKQEAIPLVGQNQVKVNGIIVSEGFAPNATITNTYTAIAGETKKKIRNTISLKLNDQDLSVLFPNTFSQTVDFRVEYISNSNNVSFDAHLTVNYDKNQGKKYKNLDYIVLEGIEELKITLLSDPHWGNAGFNPYSVLRLSNTMEIERYIPLSSTQAINPTQTGFQPIIPPAGIKADAVDFKWQWKEISKYTYSQLEWVWVEDISLASYNLTSSSPDKSILFKNNATRIDLDYHINDNPYSYRIPLLYNGIGNIYVRVRPVNYDEWGNRTDGSWSDIKTYSFDGHEPNLNWQVTTTFAEEGKSKTVISYFDGTLRSRQTVTKDNEINKTVIAETMYDLQGRPAIQILPTPGIDGIIRYHQDLNRFNGQANGYDDPAKQFDLLQDPEHLLSSKGSSNYYSPNNTTDNKNIPDANGYPYSLTRFTPDATGRIQEQSGAGIDHKIGSDHTTKYFYTKPTQEELDRLFGTEAGDFSHYTKNMVRDANGQVSISYVDMHGRTIATSLAGENPSNLSALENKFQQMTSSLINPLNNIVKGNNQVQAVTSVATVTPNTKYTFNYSLDPQKYTADACPPASQFCLDLIYKLEFTITKDNEEDLTVQPIKLVFTNADITNGNVNINTCSTSVAKFIFDNTRSNMPASVLSKSVTGNDISFEILFDEIGTYTIRKTLSIDETILQKYAEKYAESGICKSLDQTIAEQYNLISNTYCNSLNPNPPKFDCTTCKAGIGSNINEYKKKLFPPNGDYPPGIASDANAASRLDSQIVKNYQAEKTKCEKLCGEVSSTLPTIRELMLADMQPYVGQYATIGNLSTDNASNAAFQKYNVLYSPTGSGSKPFYKHPLDPDCKTFTTNCNAGFYYTSSGLKDMTAHGISSLSTSSSQHEKLQDMTTIDFSANYLKSWLNSLLPYHPEYKKLIFSEIYLSDSYNWLNKISNINTWDEAALTANNFINVPGPQTFSQTTVIDKLFIQSTAIPIVAPPSSSDYNSLYSSVNLNYKNTGYSMWQIAYSKLFCQNGGTTNSACLNDYPVNPASASGVYIQYAPSNLTTFQKNQLWTTFKALYIQERNRILNNYVNNQPNVNHNDCKDIANEKCVTDNTKSAYNLHFPISESQQITQTGQGNLWETDPTTGKPVLSTTVTTGLSGTKAVDDEKESVCNGYINTWKNELMNCPAITNLSNKDVIITEIVTRMKAVCKYGYDDKNPYGSSNIATGTNTSVTERSFEDVITNVFNSYSAIDQVTYKNLCNPYIFESPKPNGKNPVMIASTTSAIQVCNCSKFNNLKSIILSDINNTVDVNNLTSLNTYLQNKYGETISQQLFDALKKCPNSSGYTSGPAIETTGPTYLDQPSEIPQFLKCDYNPTAGCIDCQTIKQLTIDFKTYFNSTPWSIAPVKSSIPLTDVQIEANIIWGKYINYKSGLQFTWQQYLQAADTTPCNLFTQDNSQNNNTVVCRKPVPLTTVNIIPNDPCLGYMQYAINIGQAIYSNMVQTQLASFEADYRKKALEAQDREVFTFNYENKEYHFTLYYYNQAGNLVKTVPPKGIDSHENYRIADQTATKKGLKLFLEDVAILRYRYPFTNIYNFGSLCSAQLTPNHQLTTNYRYNSLNQVVAQNAPDAGTSYFWYDPLGRLVISQNAKQAANSPTGNPSYSYTLYDALGRINEVGQIPNSYQMTNLISKDKDQLAAWLTKSKNMAAGGTDFSITNPGNPNQVTITHYDNSYYNGDDALCTNLPDGLCQKNLRNRVSYTVVVPNLTKPGASYILLHNAATYYSYDIQGNVDELLQDYGPKSTFPNAMNDYMFPNNSPGSRGSNRSKKITYNYDLISGKVNQVNYQPGEIDQFYHRYNYDAENRLTLVETSQDKVFWEKDARYSYYKHGPLQRTELGDFEVQGLDYAYTLQGWLKGVNSTNITTSSTQNFDMGQDGIGNNTTARDVFAFSLNYYANDYKPIGLTTTGYNNPFAAVPTSLSPISATYNQVVGKDLFNGNISSMLVNIPSLGQGLPMLYGYRYDQLNRVVCMNAYTAQFNATNTSMAATPTQQYMERVSYDANGNILTYLRNGDNARLNMDNMTYSYKANTNQLTKVADNASDAAINEYDKYKDIKKGQVNDNYQYDAIGNLIIDKSENIYDPANPIRPMIEWTVYGKIAQITKVINGFNTTINYSYDASGNRISKIVSTGTGTSETWYVRDASGNIMSIYEKKSTLNSNKLTQTEVNLYGSSRLGIMNINRQVQSPPTVAMPCTTCNDVKQYSSLYRGNKVFELSNHLGNVMVTITDKKVQVPNAAATGIDHYEVEIKTATDYYPFGMPMPGRNMHAIIQGTSSSGGTTTVGANTYVTDLIVTNRIGNTPSQYKAANSIEFVGEYVDNGNENYEAFIVDANHSDPDPSQGTVNGTTINDNYPYGFNGKENDKDISEGGQDYGLRIYDGRLGKFLSVDPLTAKYPFYTPYQYAGNSPIKFIDLDGAETYDNGAKYWSGQPLIDMTKAPSATSYNAAGVPRNAIWMFKEQLAAKPEMFSESNKFRVNILNINPVVDKQWVKYNPASSEYIGNKLVSHHVEGGELGAAIPQQMHLDKFSELHPYIRALRGLKISGLAGGTLNVLGTVGAFSGIFSGNPDSWINAFGYGEPNIGDINKDWSSGLYVQIMNIQEHYIQIIGKDGQPVKDKNGKDTYRLQSKTVTANVYSEYVWDADKKKYEGVNKVETKVEIWKYDEDGNRCKEEPLKLE